MSQQATGRPPVIDMSVQNDKDGSGQGPTPEVVLKPNAALAFIIPIRTKSGNAGHGREFWAVRHKRVKSERATTAVLFRVARNAKSWAPTFPLVVKLTRIKPSGRRLDASDNLPNALKSIVDQIAQELGVDDGDTTKIRFEYGQEKGPWGVRVGIT